MNYDLSKWHPACGDKQLCFGDGSLSIYCPKCGIVANVEAIAAKIPADEACKVGDIDRASFGDQSINVNKGEAIK